MNEAIRPKTPDVEQTADDPIPSAEGELASDGAGLDVGGLLGALGDIDEARMQLLAAAIIGSDEQVLEAVNDLLQATADAAAAARYLHEEDPDGSAEPDPAEVQPQEPA
jgi:hypothetical protein